MTRKKSGQGGIVYSTDPDFKPEEEHAEAPETLPPDRQRLYLRLDTRQRAGKAVTLVEGFMGTDAALTALGKTLKGVCGTGGSVKDGIIMVQGDQRQKLSQWLSGKGYKIN